MALLRNVYNVRGSKRRRVCAVDPITSNVQHKNIVSLLLTLNNTVVILSVLRINFQATSEL